MDQLTVLKIGNLSCESWVANEFLDMLCCCDLPEHGLEKLTLNNFYEQECEPFEEEVMSRIANICPRLTSLQLTGMEDLTEEGKLSIANLFRQII